MSTCTRCGTTRYVRTYFMVSEHNPQQIHERTRCGTCRRALTHPTLRVSPTHPEAIAFKVTMAYTVMTGAQMKTPKKCSCVGCRKPSNSYGFFVAAAWWDSPESYSVQWRRFCANHRRMYEAQIFKTHALATAYIITTLLMKS